MTDDDFIRAVLAEPDDDLLRLAYADWLEEQDDPRSEFLRIEIALISADPRSAARDELATRLREMSAFIKSAWLRAVSRVALERGARIDVNDIDSIAFSFLELLDDSSKGQKGWRSLLAVGRELNLSDNEIKDVIQHLAPLRLLEWRSGSRQSRASLSLTLSAVISARGHAHVKAMLGRPADPKSARGRTSRKGDD